MIHITDDIAIDEKEIREVGSALFNHYGYRVITASDGEKALEIYKKKKNEVDLVLMDYIMPGMGGKQCIEKLSEIDPDVKVIVASGYSIDGLTRGVLEEKTKGIVKKPYDIAQMLTAVREALDNNKALSRKNRE